MKIYKIGELAKQAGVTTVTLRYYEKLKLLIPSQRSDSGYRYYTTRDAERLKFINNAKSAGFTLQEIKKIFSYIDKDLGKSVRVKELVQQKIGKLDEQIKSLSKVRKALKELDSVCAGGVHVDVCPIIKKLASDKL